MLNEPSINLTNTQAVLDDDREQNKNILQVT